MIWLPVAILIIVAVLVIAIPWRRPHPNHKFIFDLLECFLAEHEKAPARFTVVSSSCNEPLTIARYKTNRGGI